MSVNRTIKRLTAILTCVAGILLLLIVGATHDLVIRTLTTIAGACLMVSGGIQFWMLRRRRKRAWGDEIPY